MLDITGYRQALRAEEAAACSEKVVIKNTFLEVVDSAPVSLKFARSRSDADLRTLSSSSRASTDTMLPDEPPWQATEQSRQPPVAVLAAAPAESNADANAAVAAWGSRRGLPPGGFLNERLVEAQDVSAEPAEETEAAGLSDDTSQFLPEDTLDGDQEGQPGWSIGSELHASGACKPCLYKNSRLGCLNGEACRFCHLSGHARKSRARPSKSTRVQCKQIATMLDQVFGSDPQSFAEASQRLASQSSYMRSILKGRAGLLEAGRTDSGSTVSSGASSRNSGNTSRGRWTASSSSGVGSVARSPAELQALSNGRSRGSSGRGAGRGRGAGGPEAATGIGRGAGGGHAGGEPHAPGRLASTQTTVSL